MTEATETITETELDLVHFIERFHASYGSTPSDEKLRQRFDGLTPELLRDFKENPLVIKSFKARGIMYPPMEDMFTADQMHAIAAMTDLVDRRSDEKKLRDIGVTTRQWATWLLDDQFAQYVNARAEKLLANSNFEGHKALLKGARNGNVNSAKMLYEITGRYNPNAEAQVDVRTILYTFIEILQRHVKDPSTLNAIAMELGQVASVETIASRPSQITRSNVQPSLPPPPNFGD